MRDYYLKDGGKLKKYGKTQTDRQILIIVVFLAKVNEA